MQEVGSEWGPASNGSSASLPVDPSLDRQPELSQPTRGGRLVHVKPGGSLPDELEATIDDGGVALDPQTVGRHIRRAVLGPPLRSTAIVQERMRKLIALPVLSADALLRGCRVLRSGSDPTQREGVCQLLDVTERRAAAEAREQQRMGVG